MAGIFQKINQLLNGPEIAIFHEFHKPPYGGGNTFLLALEKELLRKGYEVGRNTVGRRTKAVLFNSYQFDCEKLRNLKRKFNPKMIHRVDGPISVYRGKDTEIDREIWQMNHELADVTVFQSQYSFDKLVEMGLKFKNPTIISNASDPEYFHSRGRIAPPDEHRKIRLITTGWSTNPKKGGALLAWLNEHMDKDRYELTYSGRVKADAEGSHVTAPVPSKALGQLLREHDIYIAPSQDDPCSNSLVEALSCGLPAVYLKSGGHPELVKEGGEGFGTNEELLAAIDKVVRNYEYYQSRIKVQTIEEAAQKYLKLF